MSMSMMDECAALMVTLAGSLRGDWLQCATI